MAVIKLQRPKLNFGEKIYLGALVKGFILTMTHAVKTLLGKSVGSKELASSGLGVTMQFPEQRWDEHMPEYYRGAPALVTDEQGRERCVSCSSANSSARPRRSRSSPAKSPPMTLGRRLRSARSNSMSI